MDIRLCPGSSSPSPSADLTPLPRAHRLRSTFLALMAPTNGSSSSLVILAVGVLRMKSRPVHQGGEGGLAAKEFVYAVLTRPASLSDSVAIFVGCGVGRGGASSSSILAQSF